MVGKLPPETVNPVPEIESELMVTAAVPLDVTVTDLETAVPTETLPKASEVALRERDGVAAFNCRAALCEEEFEVAVSVADWAVVTEATVAVKAAVEAPAATVTLAGTVTALSLLASVTTWPPVGAAPDRLTEQESDSAPVIDVLPHETALTLGSTAVPVPLRLTEALCELLEIVNWPLAEVAVDGANWTDNTTDCPGFNVVGKPPPETENPEPEIRSELMVKGAVPLEVTVTELETAVPTETLPKASEVELRLRAGVDAGAKEMV